MPQGKKKKKQQKSKNLTPVESFPPKQLAEINVTSKLDSVYKVSPKGSITFNCGLGNRGTQIQEAVLLKFPVGLCV